MQIYKQLLICLVAIGLMTSCQQPSTENSDIGARSNATIEQDAADMLSRSVRRDLEQHTTTSDYHITTSINLNQPIFLADSSLKATFEALNESIADIQLIRDRDNALLDAKITINSGGVIYNHSMFFSEDTSLIIKMHNHEDYLTVPADESEDNTELRRVAVDLKDIFYTALTKDLDAAKWTVAVNQMVKITHDENLKLSVITATLDGTDVFNILHTMIKEYTDDSAFMTAMRDNIKRHAEIDGKDLTKEEINQKIDANIASINKAIDFVQNVLDIKKLNITIGIDDKELIVYEHYDLDATYNATHTTDEINAKDKSKDIDFKITSTAKHGNFGEPYTAKKVVLTPYNSQTLESLVMSILFGD